MDKDSITDYVTNNRVKILLTLLLVMLCYLSYLLMGPVDMLKTIVAIFLGIIIAKLMSDEQNKKK